MRHKPFPSLEQVHHVIGAMPTGSVIELRNRALVAFALLTGARDGALASFRLKHVDLVQGRVDQDARDVRTKASKTFTTWFFPVCGEALPIVQDWCHYLRTVLLWGDDDPLFPPTQIGLGENGGFAPAGLRRGECWQGAGPIREIFRKAFEAAGLPYFNPHSLRDTLVQLGEQVCITPEQFKAWSQNLGHDRVMTTLTSYGTVASRDAKVAERALKRRFRPIGSDSEFPCSFEKPNRLVAVRRLVEGGLAAPVEPLKVMSSAGPWLSLGLPSRP